MRFDPRLMIQDDIEYDVELAATPLCESVTVFIASSYEMPLAAEVQGEDIWVRAATGNEVTTLLTTGLAEQDDGLEWPGDPAAATGFAIEWCETADSEVMSEPGCGLWCGEVLLGSGEGVAGPFYVHEQAAQAWAFSTALGMAEGDVLEAQVVPYTCARSFAPGLLRSGDAEYRRLNRFWASPVRPWGAPRPVALPQ